MSGWKEGVLFSIEETNLFSPFIPVCIMATARLQEEYQSRVIPSLREKLGRQNVHSLPKLEKIVVSMGVGEAIQDRKRLDEAVQHMEQLSGQKPQICRSKKAVSTFIIAEKNWGTLT